MTGLFILLSMIGCEDEIIVNVPPQTEENSPPVILLSGPEFDPSEPIQGPLEKIWVLASDPDGADDIAAVIFRIDTITLNSMIIRPDSATEECRRIHYADNDTINIMPFLETTVFTIEISLYRQNSLHSFYATYPAFFPNQMSALSPYFGRTVKDCSYGGDYNLYLDRFGMYPPAIAVARDVHVTRIDLSLHDISITVYDQSGATATVEYPDLEVFFTNATEEATLP
jgi:hypothetical protein